MYYNVYEVALVVLLHILNAWATPTDVVDLIGLLFDVDDREEANYRELIFHQFFNGRLCKSKDKKSLKSNKTYPERKIYCVRESTVKYVYKVLARGSVRLVKLDLFRTDDADVIAFLDTQIDMITKRFKSKENRGNVASVIMDTPRPRNVDRGTAKFYTATRYIRNRDPTHIKIARVHSIFNLPSQDVVFTPEWSPDVSPRRPSPRARLQVTASARPRENTPEWSPDVSPRRPSPPRARLQVTASARPMENTPERSPDVSPRRPSPPRARLQVTASARPGENTPERSPRRPLQELPTVPVGPRRQAPM